MLKHSYNFGGKMSAEIRDIKLWTICEEINLKGSKTFQKDKKNTFLVIDAYWGLIAKYSPKEDDIEIP
uniref:Uncharacterized protein n=1 Tax=Rhabditophanes sp. KR3021 TaxID=114890 RepID=A0AC35TK92_9BILA